MRVRNRSCDSGSRNWSDRATSQGMLAASKTGKDEERLLPLETPERNTDTSADTSILTPEASFQISNLQVRNLCGFKPLRLWQFATAVPRS